MIGKIAVSAANFAIDKPYSYWIPQDMALAPGQRVMVPFGRANRRTEGIVLTVEPGSEDKLKPVESCLDDDPILTETQLRLAAFLRERYFCTFFDAIRVMLPAGLWFRTRLTVSLTEERSWKDKTIRKEGAAELLELLENLGGTAQEEALRNLISDEDSLREVLSYLRQKKWITCQTDFLRKTQDKSEKIATLAQSPEETMAYAASRPRSAAMQRQVLELLCSVGSAAVKDVCYFTGASTATVNRLEKLGYLTLSQRPVLRCREIRPAKLSGPLVLNEEQQACFEGLASQMAQEEPGVALLYGVTGSGKTSVYIRLIQTCLEKGKSAMLLVPEIALTPQLLGILAAYFGTQVAVLHSSLSAAERYDQWKRVKSGDARVVVGTRSAVFAPCTPGLIILDEEQEHSYKSESAPRYDAKEVAIWRGAKEKALVVLGSATPSIESMYRAKTGLYRLYTLHQRYNGRPLPEVEIVDMREELKLGNDTSLSIPLRQRILETRQAGKQTILLLNRRGNSRALVCIDCRQTPECPRCSVHLTYHSANSRLMCHYCGFSMAAPDRCPACGGPLKTIGIGTQKVQQELAAIENYDDDMAAMAKEIETLKGRLKTKAAELTRLRKRAALELSRSICEQLQALGMPKAVFRIDVTPADKYLPTGNDNVAMFFSANPGEQEKLLQKVASGGELSRIALAIKTVAASRDSSVPSMVFDEIDTGIGGRTAQMVAERIALVAAYKQVLCITHLPQIACMADIHLYIAKESAGENTITKIRPLTERERISEIARMASGADITTASLDNAKEMVSHARIKKQNFSKS